MKKIYKYQLKFININELKLPKDYTVLSMQMQGGQLSLWIIFDLKNENNLIDTTIGMFATGELIKPTLDAYLGTFQLNNGAAIFHVFTLKKGFIDDNYNGNY